MRLSRAFTGDQGAIVGFCGSNVRGVVAGEVVAELPHSRQQRHGAQQLDGRRHQRVEGIRGALRGHLPAKVSAAHGGERLHNEMLRGGPVGASEQLRATLLADRPIVGERVSKCGRLQDDQTLPPAAGGRPASLLSRAARALLSVSAASAGDSREPASRREKRSKRA